MIGFLLALTPAAMAQPAAVPSDRVGPRTPDGQGRETLRPTQRLERIALARQAADAALATLPPNAPIDGQILATARDRVGERLESLRRAGSLAGNRPEHGWTVRCDASTTRAAMRREGRLGCMVGIALSRPAEFHFFEVTRGGFRRG